MNQNDIIKHGQEVISTEIQGLEALKESLNESFARTCTHLNRIKGRIVITGMGKSGHIGKKIAASLASTGSPSFFIHPAEAIHGDLGMITRDDAIIAISNSGNTAELEGIIAYGTRFEIPIIAITSNKQSTLGKASTYCLLLPKVAEVGSLKLAPTTSTTMTLALGDAIATVLLEMKGFSAKDFKVFHPGGLLGSQLKRVQDVMHKDKELPTCDESNTLSDAIIVMTSKRLGCVGIINAKGNLIGILTDGDLRRHMQDNSLTMPVQNVMNAHPITIAPDKLLAEALKIMSEKAITNMFVLQDHKPIGVIHIHDILKIGVS